MVDLPTDTGDAPAGADLLARGRAEQLGAAAKRGRRPFDPDEVDELRAMLSAEDGTAAAAAAALRWLAVGDADSDGRLDPAGRLALAPHELAAQLDREDASVRLPTIAAAAAIGRQHPNAVAPIVDRLFEALDRPDSRAGAAEELGLFSYDCPAPLRDRLSALRPAFEDDSAYARDMAAYTVKNVAETYPDAARESIDPLSALLYDPDSTVRGSAAWALGATATVATDSVFDLAPRLSELAASPDEVTWTREGGCAAIAAIAAEVPARVASPSIARALIACLDDRIAAESAAVALGRLAAADPDVLAPAGRFLAACTLDDRLDTGVRIAAAGALAELRSVRPRSRTYAVRGLTRQSHRGGHASVDALRILAPLDPEEARTRLRGLMGVDDEAVRDAARKALRRVGRPDA